MDWRVSGHLQHGEVYKAPEDGSERHRSGERGNEGARPSFVHPLWERGNVGTYGNEGARPSFVYPLRPRSTICSGILAFSHSEEFSPLVFYAGEILWVLRVYRGILGAL